MADVKWIRIAVDLFDNRKIKALRKNPSGNSIVLIWIMLLTVAGRCNDDGKVYLTEAVPYTAEMIASEFQIRTETVQRSLSEFQRLDMISYENGFIVVKNWCEYQNTDGLERIKAQNRERVAAFRERKKAEKECNVTGNVTGNVTVTQCNATEEELDKEIEKDTSSSSSAHARGEALNPLLGNLGEGIVRMSDEQFDELCNRLSLSELNHYFDVIKKSERDGRHYAKSHYKAIIDMVAEDRKI